MVVVAVELTEAVGSWIDLTRQEWHYSRIRKFVPITLQRFDLSDHHHG